MRRNSSCSTVSTPSAITRTPSECASEITAWAIAASCPCRWAWLTNVRSILRQSIGKRERYRRVGIAQQHVEFLAVARSDARPDAQVDVEVASLEQERRVHRLADLARHGENVVRTREIGREHRKGVSTEPRHGVAFANGALQAVGDPSPQGVAGAGA